MYLLFTSGQVLFFVLNVIQLTDMDYVQSNRKVVLYPCLQFNLPCTCKVWRKLFKWLVLLWKNGSERHSVLVKRKPLQLMSLFWINENLRIVFLLFLTLKLCLSESQFWRCAISGKWSTPSETKRFCSVSLDLSVENPNMTPCIRAIGEFFIVERKWIFHKTKLKNKHLEKNIEFRQSFGKWPHLT